MSVTKTWVIRVKSAEPPALGSPRRGAKWRILFQGGRERASFVFRMLEMKSGNPIMLLDGSGQVQRMRLEMVG